MTKHRKVASPKRTQKTPSRAPSPKKSLRNKSEPIFSVGRKKLPFPTLSLEPSPKNKYQNLYEELFGIQKTTDLRVSPKKLKM